ncbi:hypothetical protein ACFWBF_08275 [Streptomyces sp. NPDC060028]|uniref:hypothetical protein n=1 Tax=Streptomyces sp. NPDC060028 TaxID=3347041 RepID=UPI0036CEA785
MMADEIVVAGATAAMNAIAGIMGQMSWPEISDRIRGVLTRRGRAVAPGLDAVLRGGGDDAPDDEVLGPLLERLTAEDLTAIRDALGQPAAHTEINQYGGKNAVNSGPGTQNVTFN